MTGTTHFVAGAAIGRLTGNVFLTALFGFVFHFAMDLVPHWDYGYHFQRKLKHFLVAGSEPFIGFFVWVAIGLWRGFSFDMWLVTFIGGAFCLLPDVLSVFVRLFRISFLRPIVAFHSHLHWFIPNLDSIEVMGFEKVPITKKGIILGIIYQIPFIAASIYFLMR